MSEVLKVELPVYKNLSVPLYYYPTPLELRTIKEILVRQYGTIKRAKAELRRRYKCFLSENAIWKTRVPEDEIDIYAKPPEYPRPVLINVMARGIVNPEETDYMSVLRGRVKLNPYRTPEGFKNPPFCFGFYAKKFETVEELVDELGRSGLIDGAMIVNTVWYMKLGRQVNLGKLARSGYFVSMISNFKAVLGVIDGIKVTVFNTGIVRIVRAPIPAIANEIAEKLYGLLLHLNAVE